MTLLAALLWAAASTVVLRDQVDTVPAGQWRYEEFSVGEKLPVEVDCDFKVDEPGRARVELMTRESLRALLKGEEHEPILTSTSGTLHQEIGVPGNFALVIVNPDNAHAARVAVRVTLDTGGRSLVKAKYVSSRRRMVVILSSFVGFLLVMTLSARKLLLAMKR